MEAQNTLTQFRGKGWYKDSIIINETRKFKEVFPDQSKTLSQQIKGTIRISNFSYKDAYQFFKLIQQIGFPSLISLQIQNCQLVSVQNITKIPLPSLNEIRITNCKIISIKSLRRCQWPNLRFINLKQNPILDYQYLSEMFLKSGLQFLTIATRADRLKQIIKSVNWLAKIQPRNIQKICYLFKPQRQYAYDFQYDNQSGDLKNSFKCQLTKLSEKYNNANSIFTNRCCFDLS